MRTDVDARAEDGISPDRLLAWLSEVLDPVVTALTVHRLAGGHSSGAWRIDATTAAGPRRMVLKAPTEPSIVYAQDAVREARILDAVHRLGGPVPTVLAVDDGSGALGRAAFLMEHIDGRGVADASLAGPHDDVDLHTAGVDAQRGVWESFHDALAALHAVDATAVSDASLGDRGAADVLAHWRTALLDAAPAEAVPRHLAVLDWLGDHVPAGADEAPAVCLGDARLANGIVAGTEVLALVDFEVAYIGNPVADVGYHLFFDARHREQAERPLGLPSPHETWARWSAATGRSIADRDYWTAFGAMVLCITATRAMVQWNIPIESLESDNGLLFAWESTVERTAR